MRPPIRQCMQGHSYCKNCCLRMNCCPTCRSPHRAGSHLLMEQLFQLIKFPCKYQSEGCSSLILGSDLLFHEKQCVVSWKSCPYNVYGFCTWFGPRDGTLEHCQEIHTDDTYEGATFLYKWKGFAVIDVRKECLNFLIFTLNRVFHCCFQVDTLCNKLKISVNYVGTSEEAFKYCFECRLTVKTINGYRHVVMFSPCGSIADTKKCTFTMQYYLIKKYCTENDLICRVKIMREH